MAPSSLDRMIYIDDSGHPQSGLVVFGWVEFHPADWASVLRAWLDTRKRLWRDYRVPVTNELHMTEYAQGRGRISTRVPDRHMHDGVPYWKDFGREVAAECLDTLRSTQGLRTGAVWRRGDPLELAALKASTYTALVQHFEDELNETGSLALLFMDGDGTDPTYRRAHRGLRLNRRRVIEDAVHMDSRDSQLIQMADHVAWCANVAIDPHPGAAFAADWYDTYLAQRDPARGPRAI